MATRTTVYASRVGWLVDQHAIRRNHGRQIDWANVPETFRTTPGQIVTMAAAAIADAASLTVEPLAAAIPAGTLLHFGETGETVRVTTDAAIAAETLAVEAPHAAIEDGDTATVAGAGDKFIPSGTPMDEITATGLLVPRAAGAAVGGQTTIGLLTSDAHENRGIGHVENQGMYGVIIGAHVYENLLPQELDAATRTALGAIAGGGFSFEDYEDDRAS